MIKYIVKIIILNEDKFICPQKKEKVIGIVLVIVLVFGVGFITTKISIKEAEGS